MWASVAGSLGQTNYICALKGSSVDLPCSVTHPTSSKTWYTADWKDGKIVRKEIYADGNRVTYNMSKESHSTLTINDLKESDAKLYFCRNATDDSEWNWSRDIYLRVTGTVVLCQWFIIIHFIIYCIILHYYLLLSNSYYHSRPPGKGASCHSDRGTEGNTDM